MIDPITAMTAATSAYGLLKKGLAAGREIESMTGDLSRWMGAISDIKQAEVQSKNPPIFKYGKRLHRSPTLETRTLAKGKRKVILFLFKLK